MKKIILVISCLFSFQIFGSKRVGVDWFSVSENSKGEASFHISHVFLGAGKRKAYFFYEGCEGGGIAFELTNDGFTHFNSKCKALKGATMTETNAHLYYKSGDSMLYVGTFTTVRDYNCSVSSFSNEKFGGILITGFSSCASDVIKVKNKVSGDVLLYENIKMIYGDQYIYRFPLGDLERNSIAIDYAGKHIPLD